MIIYIPEKDTDVEAELAGCYNCTIFMCQICCNDCDYWRWLLGLHGGEYATVHNCLALIGALCVMNMRKVLLEYRRRFWTICCWSFRLGVGAFRSGKISEWKGLWKVEGGSWMEGSSGWRMTLGRSDVAED